MSMQHGANVAERVGRIVLHLRDEGPLTAKVTAGMLGITVRTAQHRLLAHEYQELVVRTP